MYFAALKKIILQFGEGSFRGENNCVLLIKNGIYLQIFVKMLYYMNINMKFINNEEFNCDNKSIINDEYCKNYIII